MNRYKVNRIGFVNFWLYDEENFYFYDGKLLLRGTNGSGKTVTMQSFFPLIFDGNKSPERLDPFGSRDRKIEDYLIPEDFNGTENTGYLYMEFFNKEENKYLTIGIGIKAIRNRPSEFWGFSITDNRRIGSDFLLFKERNLRIPLSKRELQTRIGTGGEYVESAKEYKKMVNKLLFGFPSIELYSEFINLLIQVRSPKLSNSTKPSQLTKILSSVLEPLNEEELREMADSLENMNKQKEKIFDKQNEQKACDNLKKSFQEYNKTLLYKKGEDYLKAKQEANKNQKDLKEKRIFLETLIKDIEKEKQEKENLKLEQEKLEHKKNELENSDIKDLTNQLDDINKKIKNLEQTKITKSNDKARKNDILFNKQKDLKKSEDELYKCEKEFDDLLKDLSSYEEEINFNDAKFYLNDLKKQRFNFKEMESYLDTIKKQINLITKLKNIAYEIYQKENEEKQENENYSKEESKLNELEQIRKEYSNNLLNEVNKLKENIAKITLENKILKINQTNLNKIYEIIDNLGKDIISKIKEIISNQICEYEYKFKLNISNNKIKINEYNEIIKKYNLELDEINNLLIKNTNDEKTKEYFIKNNIPYQYFYETIDFKDEVSKEKRIQIESFLSETGLITSFITNKSIKDINIKAKCLTENKRVTNNLTIYLKPNNTQFKDKVQKILESISLNDLNDSISLLDNGKYKLSIIEGNVDNSYELKYIGELTRLKYIEKEKEKINIAIKQYSKEISSLEEINKQIEKDIIILKEEENNYTFSNEINDLFNKIDTINLKIEDVNENLVKFMNNIKEKNNEINKLEEEIKKQKMGYNGNLKYQPLNEVLDNTNRFLELLNSLNNTFSFYNSKIELYNNHKNSIEDINYDLDMLNDELSNIDFELNDLSNKEKNINDILNSDKYKDVSLEYKKIYARLTQLKEEIPKKIETITKNDTICEFTNKEIKDLTIKCEDTKLLKDVYYQVFLDEYNLNYIENKNIEEIELNTFIKSQKTNLSINEAREKLNENFNKYRQELIEYVPKSIYLLETNENSYLNFTNDETKKDVINEILNNAKRKSLEFNFAGTNINLLELSNRIDASIKNYAILIKDNEKILFKNLLSNNVGSAIRKKIERSEDWIEDVRNLMESMNTTSGLSFSLKWVGIEPVTEDELNTKEIIKIFKSDADKLKEEYFDKIAKHFESKIKSQEDVLEESDRNYLEILKDVLDYRKWFEFKLYFKRGNNDKKELTDREFHKMSGGEKAIAMYIPLFSSVYAKLESAYPNAPHIVALDEAFAGVDDDNIKDAFRILDNLNIDYILTSQQLWGDYETVKHLAISELYHPVNSKVISIIKYKWDGTERVKINDTKEYEI